MAERVLSVRLRAIVDGYEAAMGRAATATEKVAKTGKQFESVGKKMSVGFSVPMIAAGGFALKSAISFESAFASVQKTVNGTAAEMAGLERGIVDMANSMPSTREEIAGVAAVAGQLGIQTPNILEFSRVMVDLGNSTDVAAEQAAISLAQLANITQMNQADFGRLGSSVVEMGNNFATTESRIIDMSQRLAGAGKQIGLSEAEIVGLATALSSVGVEAEAGGTAMSKVMIEVASAVASGSKDLHDWASAAGMSAEAFAQLWRSDSAAAMAALTSGLGQVAAEGGNLFGVLEQLGVTEARTRNSLLLLAGAQGQVEEAMSMSSKAWAENSALAVEAGMRYATTESQLKIAGNRATDVARKFGEVLVPAVHATLNVVDPLASGMGRLVEVMGMLPAPVKIVGGSIMGLAIAAGPSIWALGKLAGLYAPLVNGALRAGPVLAQGAIGLRSWGSGLQAAIVGMRTATLTGQGMASALVGVGAAIGPQLALVAAVAAVGAAVWVAKRRADDFARSHLTAAESSDILAASLGIATEELRAFNAEADKADGAKVISDQEFALDNSDVIKTLRELSDERARQDRLFEIGWRLRLQGASPEEVFEATKRLAKAAGVTLPVSLELEDIDNFDRQVASAVRAAQAAAERIPDDARSRNREPKLAEVRKPLENIARMSAEAFNTGNVEGFVAMVGKSVDALGDNAGAVNFLVDETLKLSGAQDVNTRSARTFVDLLEQMANASNVDAVIQERIQGWLDETEALSGTERTMRLMQLAAEDGSFSLDEYASMVNEAAEEAGNLGDQQTAAQKSAEDFAEALDAVAANASMARIDFDAGAAAAEAFGEALERSSRMGARMSAGLQGGAALKALTEGFTGQKQIAEIQRNATKENERSAKSIDRLGDSARRAAPGMSALQVRLDAMRAAGEAFSKSIDQSSMIDDQTSSALSLGDAYRSFEKTYRRLPDTLDVTAMAMGKLRPRQAEAVQNMLALGKAATSYLATMIEMGDTDAQVAGEAARMRGEYAAMFRQMGLNEGQIHRYLQAMGLTPEQVTTAIRLSGVEAASAKLNSYIQLLDGKIPAELATTVIAQIESGDVEGAARRLAEYARSNPALIEVNVDSDSVDKAAEQIARVREQLWDLPDDLDPLKAMLGGYTDAQQAALDGVMQLGDGIANYLSAVAHDGNAEEIRSQARAIRDEFLRQIGMGDQVGREYDQMTESARNYVDLVQLSDWQIDSAITLSGDAEAMMRLQLYSQFLGEDIPPEVMSKVFAFVDEGELTKASQVLAWWRGSEETEKVNAQVDADTRLANETTYHWGEAQTLKVARTQVDADTDLANKSFNLWEMSVGRSRPTVKIDATPTPAERTFAWLTGGWRSQVTRTQLDADTTPATGSFNAWGQQIGSTTTDTKVGADTSQANADVDLFGRSLALREPFQVRAQLMWERGLGGWLMQQPTAPGLAGGGWVGGRGGPTSDSNLIAASRGEFMVKAASAKSIGPDAMEFMNRTGTIPHTNLPLGTPMASASFDDSRIVDRLGRLEAALAGAGGNSFGDINVLSPVDTQMPRRIVEAVRREL